jgi:hypothetical protein
VATTGGGCVVCSGAERWPERATRRRIGTVVVCSSSCWLLIRSSLGHQSPSARIHPLGDTVASLGLQPGQRHRAKVSSSGPSVHRRSGCTAPRSRPQQLSPSFSGTGCLCGIHLAFAVFTLRNLFGCNAFLNDVHCSDQRKPQKRFLCSRYVAYLVNELIGLSCFLARVKVVTQPPQKAAWGGNADLAAEDLAWLAKTFLSCLKTLLGCRRKATSLVAEEPSHLPMSR